LSFLFQILSLTFAPEQPTDKTNAMTKFIFSLFLFFTSISIFGQNISLTEIGGSYPWLLGFEMPANDNRFYIIRQNGFIVIVDKN
jgi:hypothetical protein